MELEWLSTGAVKITPPKKPKKLTGTRFATILGLNPWSTPFEIWCDVTRTYQKPFEDTKYTIAGKTIEPMQAEYMKKAYFMRNLITPTDIWGKDYFKQTYGDFFPESKVLGGMWDYLLMGKDGKYTTVLEMKTSKRVEDWKDDIPEYYALQAALYAYLLGVDDVIMVASFLEDDDYDKPEWFEPNSGNTITRQFKVSKRYPEFEEKYVQPALDWWAEFVETGVSPQYDEKKDAEILKALRTAHVDTNAEDAGDLVKEAEALKTKIDAAKANISKDETRLKAITDGWKQDAKERLNDPGCERVEIKGSQVTWSVTKSESMELDTDAMKRDGIYAKYLTKPKTTYTIRCGKI